MHWDKLSLAWLDCGDKFSSDLATVLCSIWNNIMRNVDLAHLECKECATVSLSDLLLHKVPRQDWYIITPRRTLLTAFTDNYFTIVAGNDTFAVKFQPSAQRERSRTMHLPSILTTLPLLYLSTCVVARPTIEPLFWSEDLDEVVNQLRKHGMAEVTSLSSNPCPAALPRLSPIQTPTFITYSILLMFLSDRDCEALSAPHRRPAPISSDLTVPALPIHSSL